MGQKTALYQQHITTNAKIVDFAGWDMPLHYGSQIEEHKHVRHDAGMFDVSHMTVVDITGAEAKAYLRRLLANDVNKLRVAGKAMYSCMLNEEGGIIDDLITYYFTEERYRIVVNAATREKDLTWMRKQAQPYSVSIEERPDMAIIAIQGPNARAKVDSILSAKQQRAVQALKPFHSAEHENWLIARTGYTGEDGYEIILPQNQAADFWQKLLDAGVNPCGLGSRDSLRLEAGLNLYGTDMDESTTPLESNLAWTITWEPQERDFIGLKALQSQKQQGVKKALVGIVLDERGVLRNQQKVSVEGYGEGVVTSGTYSPTLGKSIALARIPADNASQCHASQCHVVIRGKSLQATIVKPPFVKK